VRRNLVFAALLGTLPPRSAAAGTAQGADAALAALEPRLDRLESLRREPAACSSRLAEADVVRDLSSGPLPAPTRALLLAATRPWLERLYNARAFAAGGPGVCDELTPLRAVVQREKIAGDIPFDLLCKTNYYEALMAKATILNGADMFDLCLIRNRVGDRDFKLDSLDVSCRIIAERRGTVDEVCARLSPYYDNASIAKTCPRMLRYVSGDATVCPLFEDELVRERCEGYVAFKRAAARDEAPCEKSPHCLMMRGRPGPGEALAARRVVEEACRIYARPEFVRDGARAARDEARQVARGLVAEADAAPGREAAAALDARLERAARLEARAARLAETR